MVPVALFLLFAAPLAFAARSQAAELAYWSNFSTNPLSISVANLDGSGGGALNLGGERLGGQEGMAIDTVTNRLFVVSVGTGIVYVNLDGSGAGVFTAPGAVVDQPYGVVVDPATRTIYWANEGAGASDGSIAWARLDGSAGGLLNTTGATIVNPYKVGLDPVNGRIYWGNHPEDGDISVSYARTNNTGGGDLNINRPLGDVTAFAVDPAAGRLYWSQSNQREFLYTGLLGGDVTNVDISGAELVSAYGFAVDPELNRLYWASYGNHENRVNGLGYAGLNGGGGNITPLTAPFAGPEHLLILKSPRAGGAPSITRRLKGRPPLACSTGDWGADFAGSFVYRAPHSFAYRWERDGVTINGATLATFAPKVPGRYRCFVIATNQAGSETQRSGAVEIKAARLKLSTKKKGRGEPGDQVTFRLRAVNQGDLKPKNAKLCVKLPKAAKDDLKAPKCKKLGLKGRAKKTLTIKVKVKGGADEGTDKLTFQVKGAAGKAAKSKIVIG